MLTIYKYSIILILFHFSAAAQLVDKLETSYYDLNKNLSLIDQKIDSLKSVLETKADEIDRAKSERRPESYIKRLMSEAVVISTEIESNQQVKTNLTKKISEVEHHLLSLYSTIIDSLKTIKYAGSGEDIQWQILDYTYRKFFISPGAGELSFNPQKMLVISKDLGDSALVKEYIVEAISEIDSQTTLVSALYNEIITVDRLQEQAETFLDEVEMDRDFRFYSYDYTQSEGKSNMAITGYEDTYTGPVENREFYNTTQAAANSLLYRQLLHLIQNPPRDYAFNTDGNHLTLEEYKKMLGDILSYLKSYRDLLQKKLN